MQGYKNQLMANYLNQQQCAPVETCEDYLKTECENDEDEEVAIPSEEELDDFKNKVRLWLEYDNTISKLKQALRERKKAQIALTQKIGGFMSKYNIEDLNTAQGKLRCKITEVKIPLTQKVIKERLTETLTLAKDSAPDEVINEVFNKDGTGTYQKIHLKRLKRGSNVVNIDNK